MHLLLFALSTIQVAYAAAAAELQSANHVLDFMAISADPILERRQVTQCVKVTPGDRLCERSCGSSFITCVTTPNCYAPSLGESCCADGTACKAGYYCSMAGCCPNSSTLSECAAGHFVSETLSVIKPTTLISTSPLVATTARVTTSSLIATTARVTTSSLIATTARVTTSSLIASSPALSSLSAASPTQAVATSSESTSPTNQTPGSNDSSGFSPGIPSNTPTTATSPRITSPALPVGNSGSKNSNDFMGLVSGCLGFLLLL